MRVLNVSARVGLSVFKVSRVRVSVSKSNVLKVLRVRVNVCGLRVFNVNVSVFNVDKVSVSTSLKVDSVGLLSVLRVESVSFLRVRASRVRVCMFASVFIAIGESLSDVSDCASIH